MENQEVFYTIYRTPFILIILYIITVKLFFFSLYNVFLTIEYISIFINKNIFLLYQDYRIQSFTLGYLYKCI